MERRFFTFRSLRCPRLPQISEASSFVKEILQQLTNLRSSIQEDIQSSFEDLHKQLDVRKSVLLMELEVTCGLKQKVPDQTIVRVWKVVPTDDRFDKVCLCNQVLQGQVDSLGRGEGEMTALCTQVEEALAGEPCVASLQMEKELGDKLEDMVSADLSCQPEENDQLDLVMETDGLRKSIHNLGTIVTTR